MGLQNLTKLGLQELEWGYGNLSTQGPWSPRVFNQSCTPGIVTLMLLVANLTDKNYAENIKKD